MPSYWKSSARWSDLPENGRNKISNQTLGNTETQISQSNPAAREANLDEDRSELLL